jgi:hypothetical protein
MSCDIPSKIASPQGVAGAAISEFVGQRQACNEVVGRRWCNQDVTSVLRPC